MLKTATLCVLLLCFFTIFTNAQTRDANIIIAVRDQFNGVISGAEITLLKSEKKEKKVKTDSQGNTQLTGIAFGEYQLTISATGFKEYKSEIINVRNSQTQRLEIILEVAPVESNVDVTDDDAMNPEQNSLTTVLNEKEIQNLPDNPEELARYLKRMGEALAGEELPITVNGVQGARIPPKQAIQQIRVNQNVFSAQYESNFGGGIEIFTYPTVKEYSGYVGFEFADSRFNAADPFLGRRLPYQGRDYFANFSGPLGKKASFFIGGNRSEADTSVVINAVTLNSNLQPTEFRQSFATPNRSENIYATINADPHKKHKLSLSFNFYTNRSKGQNVGVFSLPSRATEANSQGSFLNFSHTYLINENVVNQARFRFSNYNSKYFGGSREVALNVLDAFSGGGSQQESSNKNLNFEFSNDTTWQMGKYALGFGWRIRGERVNQVSKSNFGGTYTFSGRLAPILDANNNPVTDGAGNIVTDEISSLESYRRTLLFQQLGFSSQRIRELGGGANQFTISGGNPEIRDSQYDAAIYVQNSYKVSKTVAASFGLRYETQTNLSSNLNFAPRFGLIWSPKNDEKKNPLFSIPRISVGYGLFYRRFPLGSIVSLRQANDPDRVQYLITEANILNLYPNVPTVDLLERFALPQTQRFLADDFDTSYQSLFNITAVKKITKKFALNFTLSHGNSLRQSFTPNINAPLAGTFNPLNPSAAIRPFGNVGNIYETQSVGNTKTTRFSINMNFPSSPKLWGSVRYAFTKLKSDIVSGSGSPFDPYDFSQEFGPTASDGVHSLSSYFNYQLPYKFSIGGDFNISSGGRFNIFTGRDTNGDGFFSERPSFATNLNKPNLVETEYGILDPNPAPGDKLVPRNLGKGPGRFIFNANLGKAFGFGEDKANKKPAKRSLRVGVTVNNVFNIINKSNPIGNMASPNFLRILTGSSGNMTEIGDGVFYSSGGSGSGVGRNMSFSLGFGF